MEAAVRQSASAYRRGHFAVTIPALLTILEGLLMSSEGKRIDLRKVVRERIRLLQERNPDRFRVRLLRITQEFIEQLYARSDFDGPRPAGLNRHWIMHGRDVVDWDRADSLRLFQAVDAIRYIVAE